MSDRHAIPSRAAMRFAYADPPYIGQARKHYGHHEDYGGEVDHRELVERMVDEYPDGWALSLSASSLPEILSYCPPDVRVLAWAKSMVHMLPGIRLQYGWEPVILRGGRQGPHKTGEPMLRDYLVCHPQENAGRTPVEHGHVIGRKPTRFCEWLFLCLGARPGDTLDDIYPGTGHVGRVWARWSAQLSLLDGAA
jgi:hypothetical protein